MTPGRSCRSALQCTVLCVLVACFANPCSALCSARRPNLPLTRACPPAARPSRLPTRCRQLLTFALKEDAAGEAGQRSCSVIDINEGGVSPPTPAATKSSRAVLFTAMSAFAIAVSYADRSNLSTAIVQMTSQFHWDNLFSGLVLSAFWGGYALTQVIGGRLADRIGGEKILAAALLIWSVCTFATPMAANESSELLIGTRVLLGAGEGLALPSIHSMLQKYVGPSQRATAASVITAACYFGALVSNYLSPIIIGKWGWETCFYLFAAIPPLVWLPIWLSQFVFKGNATTAAPENRSDLPTDQTSTYSINKFSADGGQGSLRAMLKSPQVWAIIAAQYGQSWGMIGLLSWLPTYYSQRFQVPISELGYFTTLPYLLQMLVAVLAGNAADALINSGTRPIIVRRILQTVGMLVPAACLAYCSLAASLTATTTAAVITFGSAVSALTVGAVSCNHFDIAPKNAGMVFGIGNTASCLGGLIAVPVSGYIYDQTHSWDGIFLLFTAHYLFGALAYFLLSSDQPIAADV